MSGEIIEWFNKAKNDTKNTTDDLRAKAFFNSWKGTYDQRVVTDENCIQVYKFIEYWLENTSYFSLKQSLNKDDVIKIAAGINSDEFKTNVKILFYLIMRTIKSGKTFENIVDNEIIHGYMYFYPEKTARKFKDFMKDLDIKDTTVIRRSQDIIELMEKKVDSLVKTNELELKEDEKTKYNDTKDAFSTIEVVKKNAKEKFENETNKILGEISKISTEIKNTANDKLNNINEDVKSKYDDLVSKLENTKVVLEQAVNDILSGKNTAAQSIKELEEAKVQLANAKQAIAALKAPLPKQVKDVDAENKQVAIIYGKPMSGGESKTSDAATTSAADLTTQRQHKILESYKLKLFEDKLLNNNELSEDQIKEFVNLTSGTNAVKRGYEANSGVINKSLVGVAALGAAYAGYRWWQNRKKTKKSQKSDRKSSSSSSSKSSSTSKNRRKTKRRGNRH